MSLATPLRVFLCLSVALAASPSLVRAQPSTSHCEEAGSCQMFAMPPPPAPRRHTSWGVVGAGAGMLGIGWITNLVAGLFAGVCGPTIPVTGGTRCVSAPEWDPFRIAGAVPVIGPWVQLGIQPTQPGQDGWTPWLVADGLVQLAGLTMLIVGLAHRPLAEPRAEPGKAMVSLVPVVSWDAALLSLDARF